VPSGLPTVDLTADGFPLSTIACFLRSSSIGLGTDISSAARSQPKEEANHELRDYNSNEHCRSIRTLFEDADAGKQDKAKRWEKRCFDSAVYATEKLVYLQVPALPISRIPSAMDIYNTIQTLRATLDVPVEVLASNSSECVTMAAAAGKHRHVRCC
jgi:hypothetical protein